MVNNGLFFSSGKPAAVEEDDEMKELAAWAS